MGGFESAVTMALGTKDPVTMGLGLIDSDEAIGKVDKLHSAAKAIATDGISEACLGALGEGYARVVANMGKDSWDTKVDLVRPQIIISF